MKKGNYSDDSTILPDLELSNRYVIKMSYEKGHSCLIFRLEEDKQPEGAAGVKRPYAEKALNTIGTDEMQELFYAFLHESFITGHFGLYGNSSNCVHDPINVIEDPDAFIFEIEVKGPRKLVLSENQLYPA